jgi:predicted N-acetyltransferase YhbS
MRQDNIIIRRETPTDYAAVEHLTREAFWNVYRPGFLDGITGVYHTPKGYYVDEAAAEEFDRNFPPKEKLKLPGQLF